MRKAVKHDGEASLAEASTFLVSPGACARRNQQVLAVVGIDVVESRHSTGPENWPSRRLK